MSRKSKRTEVVTAPAGGVRKLAEDFSIGWCMVEVAMNSLEGREVGHPEQQVLRRALAILWPVNEHLSELEMQLPDETESDEL